MWQITSNKICHLNHFQFVQLGCLKNFHAAAQTSPPSISKLFSSCRTETESIKQQLPTSPSAPGHHPSTFCLCEYQSSQTPGPHVNGIIQYLPLVTDFFHKAQCPQGSSMWLHGSEFLFFIRLNNIPFRCTIFMFSPNI